jgi:MOSC domain-containing protein YiiM
MENGTVESIYITDAAAAPTKPIDSVLAIPGVGLDGDRYALKRGTFYEPLPDRELTLIEAEAIEAFRGEYGVEFTLGEARRNIVTRGVALNDLVGKEFTVGNVRIRGIRLCEPCDFLQKLTGKPVLKGLLHKGGLRAQILTEGTIHVGAQVREVEPGSNHEESAVQEGKTM